MADVIHGKILRQEFKLAVNCVQVFACTVGQKPSSAPFYVDDIVGVLLLLSKLANLEGTSITQDFEAD